MPSNLSQKPEFLERVAVCLWILEYTVATGYFFEKYWRKYCCCDSCVAEQTRKPKEQLNRIETEETK